MGRKKEHPIPGQRCIFDKNFLNKIGIDDEDKENFRKAANLDELIGEIPERSISIENKRHFIEKKIASVSPKAFNVIRERQGLTFEQKPNNELLKDMVAFRQGTPVFYDGISSATFCGHILATELNEPFDKSYMGVPKEFTDEVKLFKYVCNFSSDKIEKSTTKVKIVGYKELETFPIGMVFAAPWKHAIDIEISFFGRSEFIDPPYEPPKILIVYDNYSRNDAPRRGDAGESRGKRHPLDY